MRRSTIFASLAALATMFACNKAETPSAILPQNEDISHPVVTKAYGDKTPKVVVYVETNDVNPLNAGDYCLGTCTCSNGTNCSTVVDIVELFAANIHKDGNEPTLYLNDKLTPVLEYGGYLDYVVPLQQKGIKVLLTVLGDWQGIGVANMNDTQATHFATILAKVVERYGLDGIGFDDEYANYSGSLVSGSFGNIITKLHALMPSDKLITVFQWGNYGQIDSTAGALIDYAYHGYFGTSSYYFLTSSSISGVTTNRWSPLSLNLGNTYNSNTVKTRATSAANGGYGAVMCFNLRPRSDVDPLPVFNAIAQGAYGTTAHACSCTITDSSVTAGDRPRDAGTISGGFTIDYTTALSW